MTDISKAPRFIAVAAPSDDTNKEWRKIDPDWDPPDTYEDYALMKVLSMLRQKTLTKRYRVHPFKWEKTLTPLDFSSLGDSDVISIVGHGDTLGLYAMGPKAEEDTGRLTQILTGDGNLAAKRKEKDIIIQLLSCRAGLGLHKVVAHELFTTLKRDVTVGGAIGFTFGSSMTIIHGQNEVLIKGIPWFMEYPSSISKKDAEKETSKREKKTITYDGKKKEIEAFIAKKEKIEDGLVDIVSKLKNKEVNAALDELEKDHDTEWRALVNSQFELYASAKTRHNLEFNMWFDPVTTGYVWANGKDVTDATVAALKGSLTALNKKGTSVK